MVAELPVGQLDASQAGSAPSPPPAARRPRRHSMVLVLAAGRDGQFDKVQDYANFPRPRASPSRA
jgi:hypothetical protein